ncbi:hypothetical protein PsYK624_157860 [Phanerochaete sordida]|uniref:F-box domain-containing protein n=1 Tax=Phanerochaete sordida TaxID=48140 RepID=A0A9P3LLL7_9APHY|nr:hypothetical protein PsYK624_157860 [Phanerochaete sordida]
MPVETRTMKKCHQNLPSDLVSLKAAALVGEVKGAILAEKPATDGNIPLSIRAHRILVKTNVDFGSPVSSPTKTKSPSRLPVPVPRTAQPRKATEPPATKTKSKRGIRGPIRRLPGTLLARVFDCLHDDKDTLAACTLVHPTWTDPARRHLFSVLGFGFHPYDTLAAILDPLPSFAPSATHNIRQLALNFTDATRVPRLPLGALARALAALPHLADLLLAGLTLCASTTPPPSPPKRIERLVLDHLTLAPAELLALLGTVAPRATLALHRGVRLRARPWAPAPRAQDAEILRRVGWRALELGFHEGGRYAGVLRALRATRAPRRMQRVAVDQVWAPDVPDVCELLGMVSGTLRELVLNLRECASTKESRLGLGSGFDFGVLQKLEEVRLAFGNPHMSRELLGLVLDELKVAAKAAGRRIKLTLHLDAHFVEQIGAWDQAVAAAKDRLAINLRINADDECWCDDDGRELTKKEWDIVREKMPGAVCPA